MDDLVVILLTLAVAAFGLYGQMKKKKQTQPVQEEGKNQPENIWEMIQREMNPVPPPAPQPEIEEFEAEETEKPAYHPEYKFEAKNEGSSQIEEKVDSETSHKSYRKIAGEKFSLRKAVIYSEILNRKYS